MNTHCQKFQALVTLTPQEPGRVGSPPQGRTAVDLIPEQMQRMVVRCEHHQTHATGLFNALVSNNEAEPALVGTDHAVVTITLSGDDPEEYLSVGDHVALWRGHDVAVGVITRRLYA
jgi:hypothetical protein